MSAQLRVRRNLLGDTQPQGVNKQVRDLLQPDYFNSIQLRPIYQRHIRWSPAAMNAFVDTIMENGIVPSVLLYKLHPEDKTDEKMIDKRVETMDGQHRLFTLNAFKSAKFQKLPHIAKPFIVHWIFEEFNEEGYKIQHHVFYEETTDVDEYCRSQKIIPEYMTQEEQDAFNDFSIHITTIQKKLSIEDRRKIFMSLQNGVPVRNSDYLKNMTDCSVVAGFNAHNYEQMMLETFLPHCTKNAGNFWIQWATRCFYLFKHSISETKISASEVFLISDSKIKKQIKESIKTLNPTAEEFNAFDDTFRSFLEFLQETECKLNPTQIFALFYASCNASFNSTIVATHMPRFAQDGNKYKTIWESKTENAPRRAYFNECLEELEAMTFPALPIDETPVSKKLRKQVFAKCEDGLCTICKETPINSEDFEAGHITARARGGLTTIENLLPMCITCNREMGVRNAYEFQQDRYPQISHTDL
jgi:hypothetical protein